MALASTKKQRPWGGGGAGVLWPTHPVHGRAHRRWAHNAVAPPPPPPPRAHDRRSAPATATRLRATGRRLCGAQRRLRAKPDVDPQPSALARRRPPPHPRPLPEARAGHGGIDGVGDVPQLLRRRMMCVFQKQNTGGGVRPPKCDEDGGA